MAKTYEVTSTIRVFNRIMRFFIWFGLAPRHNYILSVRGRTSGRVYTTPVGLVINDDARWLVSPYGEVNWVKNARATGEVTLKRSRRSETVKIQEASPEEAAPILKTYINNEKITRPYFDVQPDSPLADFVKEAPRHPVFRILPN